MSGHSHFKSIKYRKAISDAQKSRIFSKLTKEIAIAAKGGETPETNPKLKMVIEKAKKANMPKESIERAIKKGSGKIAEEKLEEVLFEAYGPGGIAIIIEGITDNKNRTLGETKQVLNKNGGKLVAEGAVKWLFKRKGCIIVNCQSQNEDLKNKEKLELLAIEVGAEDIYRHDDMLDIYTKIEDLEKIKNELEKKGIKIESSSLDWVAKEEMAVDEKTKESCQHLFEALDELEGIQEIYSNLKV